MEWLANNESSLSAIAAILAILTGIAVIFRLVWVRVVDRERPTFMQDWRSLSLISMTIIALLAVFLLATNQSNSPDTSEQTATQSQFAGKPSVAVLPLNSLSDDPEQAYLADGIAEDIITLLSRNPRFFVIARHSSFTYRGQAVDVRRVGDELGVRYVVEGSVRRLGERLRVTVQLIDTTDGQHIWAEQYDRPFEKIFELQDEITNGIAVALGDQIFSAEIARANSTPTDNLDAWDLVMRANKAVLSFNRRENERATKQLRQAVALDPNYPLAKAELARSLCWGVINLYHSDPNTVLAEVFRLGEEVLEATPNDPLVLFAIGSCYGAIGKRTEAIRLLEKATRLQPNFPLALGALGYTLAFDGQPEKGALYGEMAVRHSPHSPIRWMLKTWGGMALLEMGHYTLAENESSQALRLYDGWWWTWFGMAAAKAGLGDHEGATQALYGARKAEPLFSLQLATTVFHQVYKNNGENILPLLEPIWPEDLLTTLSSTEKD